MRRTVFYVLSPHLDTGSDSRTGHSGADPYLSLLHLMPSVDDLEPL